MKINKNILIIFGLIIFAIVFERILSLTSLWERLELKTYDIRSKVSIDHGIFGKNFKHADKRIVIVSYDNYSKKKIAQNPELGIDSYPWTRDTWSEIVHFIEKGEPKAVLFDMVFENTDSNPWNDKILAQRLRKYDNIILATNLSHPKTFLGKRFKSTSAENKYLPTSTPLNVSAKSKRIDNAITFYSNAPVKRIYTEHNIMGVNNKSVDVDLTARNYQPIFKLVKNNETYYMPSLAFAGYLKYLGEDGKITVTKNKLIYKNRAIPLNKRGQIAINWHGRGHNYTQVSVAKVLLSEDNDKYISPDFFKDKIVIIGRTDVKTPSAVNKFYSSPELNATALDNFLNDGDSSNPLSRKFISKMPFWVSLTLTVLLCGLIVAVSILSKNLIAGIITGLSVILLYILFSVFAFAHPSFRLWIPVVIPLYYFIVTFIIIFAYKFQNCFAKKVALINTFGKIVSKNTLVDVIKKQDISVLNSVKKNITVLSCDIKNFELLVEKNQPDQLLNNLSELFDLITKTILENNGTINKIIDGTITAYWGSPLSSHDDTYNAIKTALEIKKNTNELKITNAKENKIIFDIKIGINVGNATLGSSGPEKMVSYSATGEAIKTALKITGKCSIFSRDILVSKTAYEKIKNKILVLEAGKVDGNEVYEPVGFVEDETKKENAQL